MFSERISSQNTANPLFKLLEKKKKEGHRILNLAESNPTRCGLHYPEELILTSFSNPANLEYNPDPHGLPEVRESVRRYYAGKNVELPIENIFLTSGTSEAYSFLFKLLCNPGDTVLVPQPGYPLFEYLAGLENVRIDHYKLEYIHPLGWRMDFHSLRERLGENTKAVIVIHPNNPTGSYLQTLEINELGKICRERNIAIISDEVFTDFALDTPAYTTPTLLGHSDALTFVLSGLSKILALPQMKLGWIAASGRADLLKTALERLELISDTFLSVNTPVQNASAVWLDRRYEFQKELAQRLKANLEIVKKRFGDSPIRVMRTDGGWTVVLEVPAIMSEEDWAAGLLEEEGIFSYPGYFFDFERGVHLTVSLILPEEDLKEGLERLERFFERHSYPGNSNAL